MHFSAYLFIVSFMSFGALIVAKDELTEFFFVDRFERKFINIRFKEYSIVILFILIFFIESNI